MAFGDGNEITSTGRNVTVQCISGTGSLRVGANFLATHFPGNKTVYLPKPSWGNHTPIMKHAGLQVGSYGYYDPTTCGLNFAAACDDIKVGNRETTSVVLHLEQKLLMGPGTRMKGPKYWDSLSLDPIERTQILGPKCLDVNMVMNVHVLTKSTVATSKHSFKSVDEGR